MKIGNIERVRAGDEPVTRTMPGRDEARRLLAESDDMERDMASRQMAVQKQYAPA